MMARVRIKVCCIASIGEAQMAVAARADAVGLVAQMPSGPGPIADETIARIARAVPPPVATFLLSSRTEPEAVLAHVLETGVGTVQLVDDLTPLEVYTLLRERVPALRIVQVIHVVGAGSIETALARAGLVDALLLDSGNPAGRVRELGGTGRVHDWAVSAEIVSRSPVPVFLAGGLNASNVAGAIERVRPFGVDVCSGVRTDGRLDGQKLAAFVRAVG